MALQLDHTGFLFWLLQHRALSGELTTFLLFHIYVNYLSVNFNKSHRKVACTGFHYRSVDMDMCKHSVSTAILHAHIILHIFFMVWCVILQYMCHGSVSCFILCFDFHALLCPFTVSFVPSSVFPFPLVVCLSPSVCQCAAHQPHSPLICWSTSLSLIL